MLGEKYIWVDSLCIVQDDEKMMSDTLGQMHMIYANCALCIVAKAGQDADFGLRGLKGISERRWSERIIFPLADGEKLRNYLHKQHEFDEPDKQEHLIPGRSYNERVWTFQEFLFARRRLMATGP